VRPHGDRADAQARRFLGVDLIGADGTLENPAGGAPNPFEPGAAISSAALDWTDEGALVRLHPLVLDMGQALHYACWDDNGAMRVPRLGCEEVSGVPPGQVGAPAKPCTDDTQCPRPTPPTPAARSPACAGPQTWSRADAGGRGVPAGRDLRTGRSGGRMPAIFPCVAACVLLLLLAASAGAHIVPVPPSTCVFDPITIEAPTSGVVGMAAPPEARRSVPDLLRSGGEPGHLRHAVRPAAQLSRRRASKAPSRCPAWFVATLMSSGDLTLTTALAFTMKRRHDHRADHADDRPRGGGRMVVRGHADRE